MPRKNLIDQQKAKNNEFHTQYNYISIYKFKTLKQKKNHLTGSESFFNNSFSIPIYVSLNKTDQNKHKN